MNSIELIKRFEISTVRLGNGDSVMELLFHSLVRPDDPALKAWPRLRLTQHQVPAFLEAVATALAVLEGRAIPSAKSPRH